MTNKVSIVLGPLAEPLKQAARDNGRTLSIEIRHRLAISLGVDPPVIIHGDPDIGRKRGKEAIAKRWNKS